MINFIPEKLTGLSRGFSCFQNIASYMAECTHINGHIIINGDDSATVDVKVQTQFIMICAYNMGRGTMGWRLGAAIHSPFHDTVPLSISVTT